MDELKLFCLIEGDPTSRAHPVKIPRQATVSKLRDAIKANFTPNLDHVAANRLVLWPVNILFSSIPKGQAVWISKEDKEKELDDQSAELAEMFPEQPGRAICIIVERPPKPESTATTSAPFGAAGRPIIPLPIASIREATGKFIVLYSNIYHINCAFCNCYSSQQKCSVKS